MDVESFGPRARDILRRIVVQSRKGCSGTVLGCSWWGWGCRPSKRSKCDYEETERKKEIYLSFVAPLFPWWSEWAPRRGYSSRIGLNGAAFQPSSSLRGGARFNTRKCPHYFCSSHEWTILGNGPVLCGAEMVWLPFWGENGTAPGARVPQLAPSLIPCDPCGEKREPETCC